MAFELEECYPDGVPEGFPSELFLAVAESDDMCVRDLALQQKISKLEDAMIAHEGLDAALAGATAMPVDHKFADGVYVRTIFMPAGTLVVSRVHLRECVNLIMEGTVLLLTVDGPVRLTGPKVFISGPGVKKVLYIETDTTWSTTHTLPPTDPEDIFGLLTVPTFKDYAAHLNAQRQLEELA